jgi:2'-5' RNA ligase
VLQTDLLPGDTQNRFLRYALACFLSGPVKQYHNSLVDDIATNFGLTKTKTEGVPAHFTLKYWFETDKIEVIDQAVEKFCKTHKKTPVRVGGFGGFRPKVVFLNVWLSDEARQTFLGLVFELRDVESLTWDQYDGEALHFHSTLAEGCDEKYDVIMKFANSKEEHFDCWFDNVTIVREVSREKGFLEWKVHKKQMFGSS